MNKKRFMFVLIILVMGFLVLKNVKAESGCCLNPYVFACSSSQMDVSDCCPDNGIYGNQGPSDKDDCVQNFFVPGESCAEDENCIQGCCCNPDPDPKPKVECLGPEGTVKWAPFNGKRCDTDFCAQFNLVQPPDTFYTCSDGHPIIQVSHIRGEKAVKLIMGVPADCSDQVKHYIIKRKSSTGAFRTLKDNFVGAVYVDSDVKWNTKYTYEIIAYYDATHSFSKTISFTTGDFVCWGVKDATSFCIGPHYFERSVFENYYTELESSSSSYEDWVNSNFHDFMGDGWNCNSKNHASLALNCGENEMCIKVDGNSAGLKCYLQSNCSLGSVQNPFGLFGNADKCEGSGDNKKYCFFDYSKSVADKCYKCNPSMECYDYKSKSACERDNCQANGVNGCEWVVYNTELNIGVCKAKDKDNCWAIASEGTGKVKSLEAHNMIFNGASHEKLDALSSQDFPCGPLGQYTCGSLICENLSQTDCGHQHVLLDKDNNIIQGSDLCGGTIKVCTWLNNLCVKDANGDNNADCEVNDLTCQKDHFPPKAILHSWASLTPEDIISFNVTDRREAQETYQPVALGNGYKLYLCGYSQEDEECGINGYNDLSDYYEVSSLSMSVQDLLQNPDLNLKIDELNTLKFFAVDSFGNVEPVHSEKIRISPFYENGLGVFVESPKPGWINSKEVTLKYYVASEQAKIYYIEIFDNYTKNVIVQVLDDTNSAGYNFEKTTPITLREGLNSIGIKVKTLDGKEKTITFNYRVDTTKPAKPVIYPLDQTLLGKTNHLTIKGHLPSYNPAEGTVILLYWKIGNGDWEKVADNVVIDANGNFSKVITFSKEGDYTVKARAKDLAGNKGEFSNNVTFTFTRTAPTFSVNPPDGAVRPSVEHIIVKFNLPSEKVGMDTQKSYVYLFKNNAKITGSLLWQSRDTAIFTPNQPLEFGEFTVEVNSVDNTSVHRTLNEQSHFVIDDVPLITTNLKTNEFKTRDNPLLITGQINGGGQQIISAHINVSNGLSNSQNLFIGAGANIVAINQQVPLSEGNNLVLILATNQHGKTAIEPFTVVLDTTPPENPTFSIGE